MPKLDARELIDILSKSDKTYTSFIESGTYLGETVLAMEKYFDNLYTIELNQILYDNVKGKSNKINFFQGESHEVFKNLLPEISDNVVFWLDGHYSSGNTSRGSKDSPILEELDIINKYFKSNAIIIIDDVRLFGTNNNEDWSNITEENILNVIKDRIKEYFYYPSNISIKDRLVIII